MNPPRIAVVVTGRDRGGVLSRCLRSVRGADWRDLPVEVIYATDAPLGPDAELAALNGARVVRAEALSLNHPVTRGAMRNAGWRATGADAVLFLAADTLLHRQFPRKALAQLERHGYAAVRGQCREALPHQSGYAAVVDLDGLMPAGDALDCAGDALYRREALDDAGGFDPYYTDGEAADLCHRLNAQRWQIAELDLPMARHDDALTRFGDYWRRAVRIGAAYAAANARAGGQAAFPHGHAPQRNLAWSAALGVALLTFVALLAVLPQIAWSVIALFGAALLHTTLNARPIAGDWRLATLYALHAHMQQLPIFYGQLAYRRRYAAARGRRATRRQPGEAQ